MNILLLTCRSMSNLALCCVWNALGSSRSRSPPEGRTTAGRTSVRTPEALWICLAVEEEAGLLSASLSVQPFFFFAEKNIFPSSVRATSAAAAAAVIIIKPWLHLTCSTVACYRVWKVFLLGEGVKQLVL